MEWIDEIKGKWVNELETSGFNKSQIEIILTISSKYVGAVGSSGYKDDIEDLEYFEKILKKNE